tara:strand:+ start:125595 stop:127370 length:1776 start_codon:yes stop_codon:yes gene_type:complete
MKRLSPILILVLMSACSGRGDPETSSQAWRINTTSGAVTAEVAKNVAFWSDIPYAQAPVGELRWRAPKALNTPLNEVSLRDNVACLQIAWDGGGVPGDGVVGTEDCLYLDITTPVSSSAAKPLPVMFWIHGGGNTSGFKGYYDFSTLVESQQVIVVAINYRLGPFGWFSHPVVQKQAEGLDRSSNFGTLDIIQALSWVQQNIGKFGGNPNSVTLFGESAGGHNVFALLASPLSDGLFHKAISQSGYLKTNTVEEAINADDDYPRIRRSSSQLFASMVDAGVLADVSTKSAYDVAGKTLMEYYLELDDQGDVPLTTADGIVISKKGMLAALADSKNAKDVPVIAGANRDEVTLWMSRHRYFVNADYMLTRWLPPRISLRDPGLYAFWARIRSEAWKLRGVDEPLIAMEAAGYPDLYAYRFDWDDQENSFFADFPHLIGAAHAIDIAFVTGNYTYGPISSYVYPEGESRNQMQELMMSAWAEFARTGSPQMPIDWPNFSAADRDFVHLDVGDALRISSDRATMASILDEAKRSTLLSNIELCLLVWDSLTKVGDTDYAGYANWDEGHCSEVDADAEQMAIDNAIIAEYGSTGF